MKTIRSKIDGIGRLIIPTKYRQALSLAPGEDVMISLEERSFRVTSCKQAAVQARDRIAEYTKEGIDLQAMLLNSSQEENADV